jgi:hypothetical protein
MVATVTARSHQRPIGSEVAVPRAGTALILRICLGLPGINKLFKFCPLAL